MKRVGNGFIPVLLKITITLVVVFIAVAKFELDARLLALLARQTSYIEAKIARQLAKKGVRAYWDFDHPQLRERVFGSADLRRGLVLKKGVFGRSAHFTPRHNGTLLSSFPYPILGSEYSLSAWVNVAAGNSNHHFLGYVGRDDAGFTLALPGTEKTASFPAPVPGENRWQHIVLSVSAGGGHAVFYIDGRKQGEIKLEKVFHHGLFHKIGQVRGTPPPDFSVDDLAFWKRALTADEARSLSQNHNSLLWRYAWPWQSAWLVLDTLKSSVATASKVMCLLNPLHHTHRLLTTNSKPVEVYMSRRGIKTFNTYQNRIQANLLNWPDSSKKRRIAIIMEGRRITGDAEVIVNYRPQGYPAARSAWQLDIAQSASTPHRKLVLEPFESSPFALELLAGDLARKYGLPADGSRLCALKVNGALYGLYLLRELDIHAHIHGSWFPGDAELVQAIMAMPHGRNQVLEAFDATWKEQDYLFFSDANAPLSGADIKMRVRDQRARLASALMKAPPAANALESIHERHFLGDNPSQDYVINDLDFSLKRIGGTEFEISVSDPGVIDRRGRVNRPADQDREVQITLTGPKGDHRFPKKLNYRVIRRNQAVPLIVIGHPRSLDKLYRRGCLVQVVSDHHRSKRSVQGGKIRYRGNTSLHFSKKSYSIKLKDHHGVLGLPGTHLLLAANAQDPTLIKNKLSYDLYRSFASDGEPRFAVTVRLVEVVANGEYLGVYGASNRIDARLLGMDAATGAKKPADSLFKPCGKGARFSRVAPKEYRQEVPSWKETASMAGYFDFAEFVAASDPAVFRARAADILDIGNIIDSQILVLFTVNQDNVFYNMYIGRGGTGGERFFIVPWDYDDTYQSPRLFSNHLWRRLTREYPGYAVRRHARWRELRRDTLNNRNISARLEQMTRQLADGAYARNLRRWPEGKKAGSLQARTRRMLDWIDKRLEKLDAYFGREVTVSEKGIVSSVDAPADH